LGALPRLYIPNGGHPLNVGKVAWFLALPRSSGAIYDLMSGLVAAPRGTPAYSGQQRDGSLGAALAPGGAQTGWVGQSVPLLNNLPTLGGGFSFAFWVNPLGVAVGTQLMLSKGNGNTGGWDFGTATGQLRFRASRATTDDSFLSTSATLLPAYAWRRLLVTGKLGGPYTAYVNGRSQAGTTTAGSGTYSGDTTQNLTLCNWSRPHERGGLPIRRFLLLEQEAAGARGLGRLRGVLGRLPRGAPERAP
jgi:hypothetical protein